MTCGRGSPYAEGMLRLFRAVRDRIEDNCRRRGLLYPWWIPITCLVGQYTALVAALILRDALWPLQPLSLTFLLLAFAPVVQFGLRRWLPWWLDNLGTAAAASWLVFVPTSTGVAIDLAPALFALITAEAVARDGLREGAVVLATSLTVLVAAATAGPGVPGLAVHVMELLLGWVVGAMLLWQMRALAAERAARAQAWQQATAAERTRIAREIHDLVAHSLSVTLLQITGARHALADLRPAATEGDDPAAEADAALADAERVGRRAMADIRRTVSSLAEGPESRRPLPSAADIGGLVQELDAAGLAVEYAERGDPARLTGPVGLGLFRIAQESLANVAKHAPSSTAQVRLSVVRGGARLTVRNRIDEHAARRTPDGAGSGLAGMHARAGQLGAELTAGPDGPDWVVDLRLRDCRAGALLAAEAVG